MQVTEQQIDAAAHQLHRIAEESVPGVYTADDWKERVATDPDDYVPFCDRIVKGGTCANRPLTKVFFFKTPYGGTQSEYSCAEHEHEFRTDEQYQGEEDFATWYQRTGSADRV
jgi:hypothetical protein